MTEQAPGAAPSEDQAQDHAATPGHPEARHTPGGAPTDSAHQDAGDGSLTGSVPAGLTVEELLERSRASGRDDGGSE